MSDIFERYKQKQKENEKLIKQMNYDLHVGHIRHNVMCENCFKTLGKNKVNKLLKEKEVKHFWVLPECKEYHEDGSCNFCSTKTKRFGCNELWCHKKIEYDHEKEKGADYDQ